jgi:group I intron endonuclease
MEANIGSKDNVRRKDERNMNRKEELKQLYKEIKIHAGVYQIKNTKNQKIFIGSSMNLKTLNGKRFQLKMGTHYNKMLQKEWNEFGEEAFVFEVLEILEKKEDGYFDTKDALKKLEEKWIAKLQPFGERGYN